MTCPRCKAPFSRVVEVWKVSDTVNEFGRRELVINAKHEDIVNWLGDHYHCKNCGLDFSLEEHTFQLVNNQTFLASFDDKAISKT